MAAPGNPSPEICGEWKFLFCTQKNVAGPYGNYKNSRVSCAPAAPHKHARDWQAVCHARGSRGVPCTLYRTGPSIPTVQTQPRVGARAPKFFNRGGGGVPRATGSQHMEILLLALCKNGGASLRMGSKRQIDLYLSNDRTRRHPQRNFRYSRVKTNCI
jgi:hypothetical protein